jgi:hypothetical protein
MKVGATKGSLGLGESRFQRTEVAKADGSAGGVHDCTVEFHGLSQRDCAIR